MAYVVEGQTPTPIQPSQNQGQGVTQTSGKLNSLVEDGVIRVSDLERVAEEYSSVMDENNVETR